MAEIKIEKKKPVWPWVIAGLAVAALLIYFLGRNGQEEEVMKDPDTADLSGVHENNATVASFVSFVQDDENKMGLDHAYSHEALLKLTAATKAMAQEIGYNLPADLDKVKEYTDAITKDPHADTHADNIKKAADILTTVLQNMQQAKYPELDNEAAELRNASASINPDVHTLDQKDAVKSFFSKAADLLRKMN
ncbi:MAG: hypothetical protein ICV53_03145 [Flavisolibacter sp.]|nr:hypothetical protein [Flavisolibacter sp.]